MGTGELVSGARVFSIRPPSISEGRVFGANLPADVKPTDFDFGAGIAVKRIVKQTPTAVTLVLQADAKLPSGIRNLSMGRVTAERAFAVYDKITYIRVLPDASIARLRGAGAA